MHKHIAQGILLVMRELLDVIADTTWKYAKTYSGRAPHEYILKADQPELYQRLKAEVEGDNSYWLPFYTKNFRYVNIGKYKYWAYDTLINRTLIDGYSDELKAKYLAQIYIKGEA